MKRLINLSVLALGVIVFVASCGKDDPKPEPTATYGDVDVRFQYVFGSSQLPFEIGKYYLHPKTGDSMKFSLFKYYVTNIKLKNEDGTWWAQPESYFLLDAESEAASTFTVEGVPSGTYVEMEYTMGVDSFKNVSGVYEGALSLTNNMFWDWNTGFIMLKAEGDSPNAPSPFKFALHFGGFKDDDNIVTVKSTNFDGSKLIINDKAKRTISFLSNPARLWHSSPSLDSIYVIHSLGAPAKQMATDFYNNIAFKSLD